MFELISIISFGIRQVYGSIWNGSILFSVNYLQMDDVWACIKPHLNKDFCIPIKARQNESTNVAHTMYGQSRWKKNRKLFFGSGRNFISRNRNLQKIGSAWKASNHLQIFWKINEQNKLIWTVFKTRFNAKRQLLLFNTILTKNDCVPIGVWANKRQTEREREEKERT